MNPTIALALVCLLLTLFDCGVTVRRINSWSPNVELNPVIRKLSEKLGGLWGSILGLVLPQSAVIALFAHLGWKSALAYIAGVRTTLTLLQIKSFE